MWGSRPRPRRRPLRHPRRRRRRAASPHHPLALEQEANVSRIDEGRTSSKSGLEVSQKSSDSDPPDSDNCVILIEIPIIDHIFILKAIPIIDHFFPDMDSDNRSKLYLQRHPCVLLQRVQGFGRVPHGGRVRPPLPPQGAGGQGVLPAWRGQGTLLPRSNYKQPWVKGMKGYCCLCSCCCMLLLVLLLLLFRDFLPRSHHK